MKIFGWKWKLYSESGLVQKNFSFPRDKSMEQNVSYNCLVSGFLLGIFSGGGAKSIVMQISFVTLLLLDQILGRGKVFKGRGNCLRGRPLPPCGRKPGFIFLLPTCQTSMDATP